MAFPVGYFTQLSFDTDAAISNYLDDYTINNNRLRIPSFVACATSTLAALILRTAAVAEEILRCALSLVTSPLSERGWIILEQLPYFMCRVVVIPFKLFSDLFWIIGEPKYFIIESVEYAELHREHLEQHTVGTEKHIQDIRAVGKCAYDGLLIWQTGRDEYGDGLDPSSRWVKKNLNRRKELKSLKTSYKLKAELQKLVPDGIIGVELYKKLIKNKHLSEEMTHIKPDRLSPEAQEIRQQIKNRRLEKQKKAQEESLRQYREELEQKKFPVY